MADVAARGGGGAVGLHGAHDALGVRELGELDGGGVVDGDAVGQLGGVFPGQVRERAVLRQATCRDATYSTRTRGQLSV